MKLNYAAFLTRKFFSWRHRQNRGFQAQVLGIYLKPTHKPDTYLILGT